MLIFCLVSAKGTRPIKGHKQQQNDYLNPTPTEDKIKQTQQW